MNKTYKLTLTAMMVAIGTITSNLVAIPIGFTKVFPMQHFLNVLSAVLLGPYYAVAQAFLVSLIRNLMGTGSIFAFPGSMVGALLASLLFLKTKKMYLAFAGEVIGTGILGALLSYPIATLILGQKATLFGFIPLFIFSSFAGALLGFVVLVVFLRKKVLVMNDSKSPAIKN
ncbi:energy coupling factor transporter S component ThiW [Neobacillus bataviensis]|uniref:Energy coupling factor transporter S component ThiW n=1 Tax=Neobacillus bataviensis TaxID=220685 RepID=A0A561DY26_9BACI|nr:MULTISPECIES: energy coupling factor transporter S component ThiW [Bacillaceae]PFO08302.1 energy coupling factor transporter S component ThiW [Bacillus sp. AFS076308]PGV50688.1 energy coupling factor transporter S component ThiW [Bacillus sp. AFS037270]TWE08267.1 energy coupling factor transporter S component ThiW [Neobacillus bataviensis]